jgi:hypothetical protein
LPGQGKTVSVLGWGTAARADGAGEPALSAVDPAELARTVTPDELAAMKSAIDPALIAGEAPPPSRTPQWQLMWECISQSSWTGLWYYWDSYNPQYARYMALNACVSANGYTCGVGCRVIY